MSTQNGEQAERTMVTIAKPGILQRHRGRRIRKYFREYCDHAGIHGLRYIAERERSLFERSLWAILILVSIGSCGYMIRLIYNKYQESPVIVSFATKQSPIFSIPFPAVTICPISKSNRTKLDYTMVLHRKKNNKTLSPEMELRGQYMSLLCDKGRTYFEQNNTFKDDFFVTLEELHIPAASNLPCVFMGKGTTCSKLFKPIITDEGICYTFNMLDRDDIYTNDVVHSLDYLKTETSKWSIDTGYSDPKSNTYPRRALFSGADNALQILLPQTVKDIDYKCVKDVQGYSFMLHTPHTIPRPKKQFFQIPFDTSVLAIVTPKMMKTSQNVKDYQPIDRECYFSTKERHLRFFRIYTPENCRLECLTNITKLDCGCVNFFMPRDNTTLICGTGKVNCMRKAERRLMKIELNILMNGKTHKMENDTFCDCMPLCNDLSYDTEQSQNPWDWVEQLAPENKSAIKKSLKMTKLSVFFKLDQFWTTERNELYGPTDFLASFGGLMGLFTGFSLLSLVELIYFLTLRIFCNIKRYNAWEGTPELEKELYTLHDIEILDEELQTCRLTRYGRHKNL